MATSQSTVSQSKLSRKATWKSWREGIDWSCQKTYTHFEKAQDAIQDNRTFESVRQFKKATVYTTLVCKLDDNLHKLDLFNLKYIQLKTELSLSECLLQYPARAIEILVEVFLPCSIFSFFTKTPNRNSPNSRMTEQTLHWHNVLIITRKWPHQFF